MRHHARHTRDITDRGFTMVARGASTVVVLVIVRGFAVHAAPLTAGGSGYRPDPSEARTRLAQGGVL